ncbi:hypothetical protein PC113_g20634 [Phytophthora cactorum]|uniref:Uncharacterized protein n=1 Tax=Phytophthora cactorum TaxID=29920 RepID=A0A8T0Y314_9STRA|nr:hypothetical protein PC111_g11059 [Phytophthora cactorum]KAG2833093.1 hypothetical protein PC113_g20634 [Phytophthora cactorum]KAG3131915.1 hypothetical protein C6341_g23139 [Phytophthora cactorum]KAG3176342.1 hypothetical protein PC128_g17347 [Phytophthora cactorum]KAG4057018.1 hypothetical protein PC123_g7923 [Phytophthora cactorum]
MRPIGCEISNEMESGTRCGYVTISLCCKYCLIFLGATHTPVKGLALLDIERASTSMHLTSLFLIVLEVATIPGGRRRWVGLFSVKWANCTPLHCARKAFVGCEHEHAQRLVHLRKVDHNAHSAKKDKLDLI